MVVEHIVSVQCGGVKVYIAACQVGTPFFQQGLNHVDIFVNAVGGRLHHIGALDVQLPAVFKERVGVIPGNFQHSLILALGALDHLVFAGIGVTGQMPHVRDVHHALDIVAQIPQALFQHILHDIGAQVADMGIVIHGGATGVHLHKIRIIGDKQFLFVGSRVIQIHIEFLQML